MHTEDALRLLTEQSVRSLHQQKAPPEYVGQTPSLIWKGGGGGGHQNFRMQVRRGLGTRWLYAPGDTPL